MGKAARDAAIGFAGGHSATRRRKEEERKKNKRAAAEFVSRSRGPGVGGSPEHDRGFRRAVGESGGKRRRKRASAGAAGCREPSSGREFFFFKPISGANWKSAAKQRRHQRWGTMAHPRPADYGGSRERARQKNQKTKNKRSPSHSRRGGGGPVEPGERQQVATRTSRTRQKRHPWFAPHRQQAGKMEQGKDAGHAFPVHP